jgi:hypothetical protein
VDPRFDCPKAEDSVSVVKGLPDSGHKSYVASISATVGKGVAASRASLTLASAAGAVQGWDGKNPSMSAIA